MAQGRTPGGRPSGPGRRPGSRPDSRATRAPRSRPPAVRERSARVTQGAAALARRPRLTGRAAVLVLVLGLLAVSYASSMRAFLDQRERIGDLKVAIAERQSDIDRLEREKRRWRDAEFVQSQARQRFGYLEPGETGYQVIDEDGEPLAPSSALSDPDEVVPEPVPTAWWESAWRSVELAGDPPRVQTPATRLDAPVEDRGEGGER